MVHFFLMVLIFGLGIKIAITSPEALLFKQNLPCTSLDVWLKHPLSESFWDGLANKSTLTPWCVFLHGGAFLLRTFPIYFGTWSTGTGRFRSVVPSANCCSTTWRTFLRGRTHGRSFRRYRYLHIHSANKRTGTVRTVPVRFGTALLVCGNRCTVETVAHISLASSSTGCVLFNIQ